MTGLRVVGFRAVMTGVLFAGVGCTGGTGSPSDPPPTLPTDSGVAARSDASENPDAGTPDRVDSGMDLTPDGGSSADGGDPVDAGRPSGRFACTLVIGYSQVRQWYLDSGTFERAVDDERWQLRWNGGAGVDDWRDPDYTGWDRPLDSPCAARADDPDRVLLSISGGYGDDEAAWAEAIEATIVNIRENYPNAREIILQPVVGGLGHMECPTGGGGVVRATSQHPHIDRAIATVGGGDVVAGMSPEVRGCGDYRDNVGHLTEAAIPPVGQAIGDFYAAF